MVTKRDIDDRFRHNLIRLRRLRGLTQGELADKSGVNNIGQIESGARGAGKDAWAKLATALDVDPCEFYRPIIDDLFNPETPLLRLFHSLPQPGKWFIVDILRAFVRFFGRKE